MCSSDLDCGGGMCTANNMGSPCEESGECTGGAECVLSCPSQYLLSGLRSARPHHIQVETGAFVDPMWEPCVRSPQTCDGTVFSGAVFSGLLTFSLSFSLSFSLLFARVSSPLHHLLTQNNWPDTRDGYTVSKAWWRGGVVLRSSTLRAACCSCCHCVTQSWGAV